MYVYVACTMLGIFTKTFFISLDENVCVALGT